jgi:hypothetical protein
LLFPKSVGPLNHRIRRAPTWLLAYLLMVSYTFAGLWVLGKSLSGG